MATSSDNPLSQMVRHWLECPVGTYLGSNYGNPAREFLHSPLSSETADRMIAKLREDIAIVSTLPDDQIGLFQLADGNDKKTLVLVVGDIELEVA